MPAFQHSFKTLKRDWRSGQLRLIAAALIVAVATVTAVTLFTDRVRQAMVLRANTLLAADVALDSSWRLGRLEPQAPRLLEVSIVSQHAGGRRAHAARRGQRGGGGLPPCAARRTGWWSNPDRRRSSMFFVPLWLRMNRWC